MKLIWARSGLSIWDRSKIVLGLLWARGRARAKFEAQRFVDIEFASDYVLRGSRLQRLSTELRVPLFEGFIMPGAFADSETSAYYKQLYH